MRVSRLDFGRIDSAERTQQGFLKAPAYLTRVGVFTYYNSDGSERREWRSTAEVMRKDSLASLISAPVTDKHPDVKVTAENRSKFDMGNIGDSILRDGGKVAATMYVKDSRLIAAVERGDARETSCGYDCDMVEGAGTVPEGEPDAGQRYDAAQKNIVYNHVAVVPQGRAGSDIRLRLDAAGNSVIPPLEGAPSQETNMETERIDGVPYQVGTDAHRAAVARRDEADKARAKELADLRTEREKLTARADSAEADLKKAKADLTAATDPKRLDELATARATLFTSAGAYLGSELKLDGKSEVEIKRLVAAKANPELKLDGKADAYVEALYDKAVAEHKDAAEREGLANLRRDAEGAGGSRAQRNDGMSAYERALEGN